MHIYFVGIGGTGIGPLALIASQAGYTVSGSDTKHSEYTKYLESKKIHVVYGQTGAEIAQIHAKTPIDWVVSVSAIVRLNKDHPELSFARTRGIRITERDACLNDILHEKKLKLVAIAGTHGKTTTTAMTIWLLRQVGIPTSHSVGAKMTFAEMGHYDPNSQYFIYECDEYHRNFLQFFPNISLISGVSWDHHEVFPTRDDYKQAFREYIAQSDKTYIWQTDADYLQSDASENICVLPDNAPFDSIQLYGHHNRRDAWLAVQAVQQITDVATDTLKDHMSKFPGISRRMEELAPNIFTDYAHTPEKISAALDVAREIAHERQTSLVVVYEPLTNRRQHYMQAMYEETFIGVNKLYWVPSYLAREDPGQEILTPAQLIENLANKEIAEPAECNDELKRAIIEASKKSIVVAFSGGGGNSLDEWLRSWVLQP